MIILKEKDLIKQILITNLKIIQKYFISNSPYNGGLGLQYNFQYTTTIYNAYHIFDFIKFMEENKFIKSSEHIDFYYAWSPSEVSLNNLPEYEKIRLVEFLENGIKELTEQKTIDELKDLIKFTNSTNDVENVTGGMYQFTTEMDKLNNTNVTKLNGVDFERIKLEIIS